MGGIGAIFSGLRFLWSFPLDYGYTYRQMYSLVCIIQIFCSILIYPAAEREYKALYFIIICLTIFCEGAHFALLPSHCAEVFGPEKGLEVFSALFSSFALSALAGSVLAKFIISTPDSYFNIFIIAGILNFFCLILIFLY
jgi:predicted MFS family arabinose efflux permease